MSVLESVKKLLGGVTAGIEKVTGAKRAIEVAIAELDREAAELLSRPAPAADVVQSLELLVAQAGARWRGENGLAIVRSAGRLDPHGPRGEVVVVGPELAPELTNVVTFGLLAALSPDLVLAGLRRAIEETKYESAGPLADRLSRLRAIAQEREHLQRQHAAIVDEATAQGLSMPHLPEENARRIAAADRQRAYDHDLRANARYYERHPEAKPTPPAA